MKGPKAACNKGRSGHESSSRRKLAEGSSRQCGRSDQGDSRVHSRSACRSVEFHDDAVVCGTRASSPGDRGIRGACCQRAVMHTSGRAGEAGVGVQGPTGWFGDASRVGAVGDKPQLRIARDRRESERISRYTCTCLAINLELTHRCGAHLTHAAD